MKFYVTGRSDNYERVKEVCKTLKENGHSIVFEWTELQMVKPYDEHVEMSADFAKQSIDGMVEADAYIIFVHKDGNGVYTEFGSALAANAIRGLPKIYAIGKEAKGAAMFNYHPAISWYDTLEEVMAELGIK